MLPIESPNTVMIEVIHQVLKCQCVVPYVMQTEHVYLLTDKSRSDYIGWQRNFFLYTKLLLCIVFIASDSFALSLNPSLKPNTSSHPLSPCMCNQSIISEDQSWSEGTNLVYQLLDLLPKWCVNSFNILTQLLMVSLSILSLPMYCSVSTIHPHFSISRMTHVSQKKEKSVLALCTYHWLILELWRRV